MKLIITGGGGLVGTFLSKKLIGEGHEVIIVGPHAPSHLEEKVHYVPSNLEKEVPAVFGDCDGIIHLAGANIFHRWTKEYKQLLFDSRVKTARTIYDFLSKQKKRPRCFISASAVGFYGDRGEEVLDEKNPPGNDFLSSLCVEWEKSAALFSSLGMRTVSLRTATVLSRQGGALSKMVPLFRWGLGGKMGKGSQWFPWIHIDDLVSIYAQAVVDERMMGPINAVSPGIVRNEEFAKTLGAVLKRPALFSIPRWLLRAVLGEFSTVLTASEQVIPRYLEELGVPFAAPNLRSALLSILSTDALAEQG